MTRDALLSTPCMRRLRIVAARLIGFGGLLVLMPLFFARYPLGFATRAFVPFGWLAVLVGFGLMALEMGQRPKVAHARGRGRR